MLCAEMTRDTSTFKFCRHAGSRTLQVASGRFQICCHPGTQNLVPMSTHPVLLGRVTGLNVGNTPKREGQASQPSHVDIEASPSPTTTRVTHGDSEDRPSWTWRCVQMLIALLVVIFTTWRAIVIGSQDSWDTPTYGYLTPEVLLKDQPDLLASLDGFQESWVCRMKVVALKDDQNFIALIVSTGIAGLAAMWLYLVAPTAHILLAARFLFLNWVEGLVTLSFIAAAIGKEVEYIRAIDKGPNTQDALSKLDLTTMTSLLGLRWSLLLCEFVGWHIIIQNRLQSLWSAEQQPECRTWWCLCGVPGGLVWSVVVTVRLFRVSLMFQKALEFATQQGLAVAATFQACHGRTIVQCIGVIIMTTSLTASLITAVVIDATSSRSDSNCVSLGVSLSFVATRCISLLVNAAGIMLLSGASSLITSQGTLRFPPLQCCRCPCRFRRCCGFQSPPRSKLKIGEENDWEKKTRELANRGISLEELLVFYKTLGDTVMQSFQPSVHTTTDVVRLAIIPLTASSCSSYSQLVNKGEKVLPKKMITHNWSNLFRDLLASVISDALGEHTFEFVAELLSDKAGVEALEKMLGVHGSLQETYWICAFAVNQHAGICGANPAGTVDPVTGLTHPTCQCSEPKFFNEDPPLHDDGKSRKSIQCEMNKFDDMMALLARENPDFAEVVAVDASLDLFGRAWCVAELAEAHRMGMAQSLKMRNEETLLRRQLTLQGLKVENMKASRPEDVVEILAKIPDKEAFNAKLQELIFDSNVGLVAAWKNADALQQMEEVSHLLKWLRLSEAVEGGHIVWQRWLP